MLDRIKSGLGAKCAAVLDQVKPHSPTESIVKAVESARQARIDVLVSAGGGSAIDSAKGVAALLAEGGSLPRFGVRFTPPDKKDFVADPSKGSRHNRGAAVDLTLYNLKTGKPVEMVSTYDETTERAHPDYPGGTSLQRWHRNLLRSAMEADGFTVFELEWWHFDFKDWQHYRISNETFERLGDR